MSLLSGLGATLKPLFDKKLEADSLADKVVYTEAADAPSDAKAGDEWKDTDDGKLYKAVNGTNGIEWMEV